MMHISPLGRTLLDEGATAADASAFRSASAWCLPAHAAPGRKNGSTSSTGIANRLQSPAPTQRLRRAAWPPHRHRRAAHWRLALGSRVMDALVARRSHGLRHLLRRLHRLMPPNGTHRPTHLSPPTPSPRRCAERARPPQGSPHARNNSLLSANSSPTAAATSPPAWPSPSPRPSSSSPSSS